MIRPPSLDVDVDDDDDVDDDVDYDSFQKTDDDKLLVIDCGNVDWCASTPSIPSSLSSSHWIGGHYR